MSFSKREMQRLRTQYGPWALVTGASSGIGKEIGERLAEAGLNLLLTARRQAVLDGLANEWRAHYGVEIETITADMSQATEIEALLQASRKRDIGLVVVAAGFGTSGAFLQADLSEERNMLAVNCAALLSVTHHFTQRLTPRGRGGIILLSSMVGFQGVPFAAHYAATKAYVQSLGEALAVELKPHGVDVLAAAPGPVASGFAQRANMRMDRTLSPAEVGVPILKALGRQSTVLPGWLTKLLVGSLRTVPRWAKVRIMKMVMGGMTKHQIKGG
ncbi:MAG: SDR family NAD(P)-dependent oxidoreductase [Bacteroidota bacterium]